MRRKNESRILEGQVAIDLAIAAALGVVSLMAVVLLAFVAGQLTSFQQSVIWTLLAFGVAGVSVFVPGLN